MADGSAPAASPEGPPQAVPFLEGVVRLKFGTPEEMGWGPKLRLRFGYHTPDDWYEALVASMVRPETEWLDVGCGRDLFPSNPALARRLAERCRWLAGVDPSDNIDDNPLLMDRAKCMIEDYRPDRRFDLITMRMIAEHVEDPPKVVAALARLARPGGDVVVYTPGRWALASIVASLTPLFVHQAAKHILWGTEKRDTFPTAFLMNTRHQLRTAFEAGGFTESQFFLLDDTRTLNRWYPGSLMELRIRSILRRLSVRYPEFCILAVYRRG